MAPEPWRGVGRRDVLGGWPPGPAGWRPLGKRVIFQSMTEPAICRGDPGEAPGSESQVPREGLPLPPFRPSFGSGGAGGARHISGEELAHGVRDLALKQYGPMARTVLGHWGIHGTDDLGEIVFAMVECGVLDQAGRRPQGGFPGSIRLRGGLRTGLSLGRAILTRGDSTERACRIRITVGLGDLPAVGRG